MIRHNRKVLGVFLLLFLLGLSLFRFRHPLLTQLAGYLIISDALEQADAIAVLSGEAATRCHKAAELFLHGWAPSILVTKSYYPDEARILRSYGVWELESHEKCLAVLRFHHVPDRAIEILDGYNESTADEATRLQHYLHERGSERLIVVTSNYHTRRSRLLFRRVFRDTGVQVSVQAAPPNFSFDPNAWWTRRKDRTVLLLEYQKLLFYAVRYW
jgi:uncharacterized SAM-binding protein YcdF (DUF218 family)